MNIDALLQRIDARVAELGTTLRAVSIEATGSGDTIRNWQRRHRAGETFSMRQASLEAVAQVLGVTTAWLLHGIEPGDTPRAAAAEETEPYRPKPSQADAVRALFADTAQRAEAMRRLAVSMPGLGFFLGDLLICDLARDARSGDTVMVHIEDGRPNGSTVVRKWFPPWLLTGDPAQDAAALRDDQPGVTVRYPVVGLIRGT